MCGRMAELIFSMIIATFSCKPKLRHQLSDASEIIQQYHMHD